MPGGSGENAQGFCQSGDWFPRRFMRPVHENLTSYSWASALISVDLLQWYFVR